MTYRKQHEAPLLALALAASLALAAGPAAAQAPATTGGQQLAQDGGMPAYKPPMRGAPQGRIGGATRGAVSELPKLDVIAPDHVGLTVSEQPTLYWFVSKPVTQRIQVTVTSEKSVKPVLELDIRQPPKPGINALRLADHNVKLEPNVEYDWSVAIVPDAAQRSGDLVASGILKRVPAPAALSQALAKAAPDRQANVYAENGIWYDAIDAISRAIERQPNAANLRQGRAALLAQVGLADAAAFERAAK